MGHTERLPQATIIATEMIRADMLPSMENRDKWIADVETLYGVPKLVSTTAFVRAMHKVKN